jgi:hypothetical protein
VLTGCLTEKRALKKMNVIAARKPDAALKFCADRFPSEVKTITDTKYLPGQTVYDTAMVYVDCDSVLSSSKLRGSNTVQIKRVAIPCPPSSHTTDTVVKTITNTVTNTAKELLLTKERDEATANAAKQRKGKRTWMFIGLGGLAVLVAGFVLRLKKLI